MAAEADFRETLVLRERSAGVEAEETVDPFGGTRHTSGRRYSYDDPRATVIAVSEDGPVTVLRNGAVLGRSQVPGATLA